MAQVREARVFIGAEMGEGVLRWKMPVQRAESEGQRPVGFRKPSFVTNRKDCTSTRQTMRPRHRGIAFAILFLPLPAIAASQGVDLTVNHVGIGIGDVPRITGLRFNYRDRTLERVDGINATIWTPYKDARHSVVRGIALGIPATGAGDIDGLAVGILGVGAEGRMRGVGVSGIGIGAGGSLEGVMVGGIGAGSGGDMTGVGIGGIGLGSGGRMKGVFFGGVGVGSSGDVQGILIGGIGSGAGRDMRGVSISGIASGAGRNVQGLTVAGIAAGAGGDVTGITLAGIAAGAGGTVRGLTVAGIAAGAPNVRGITIAGIAAGGENVRGIVLAGAYVDIAEDGEFRGISASAFNRVRGTQRGLTIGLVNFARDLHGAQIGLINIARNNPPGRKILPIVNWHRD